MPSAQQRPACLPALCAVFALAARASPGPCAVMRIAGLTTDATEEDTMTCQNGKDGKSLSAASSEHEPASVSFAHRSQHDSFYALLDHGYGESMRDPGIDQLARLCSRTTTSYMKTQPWALQIQKHDTQCGESSWRLTVSARLKSAVVMHMFACLTVRAISPASASEARWLFKHRRPPLPFIGS